MPKKRRNKPALMYKLQDNGDSDMVVVATKNIKQGTVVFEEGPILYSADISDDDILNEFSKLSVNDKVKYLLT